MAGTVTIWLYFHVMPPGRKSAPGALSREVAAILTEAWEASGMKQAELGARAGISQSQVSKYLRGERVLTVDELDALCSTLGLKIATVIRVANARR